jgi:hypothetical protein
MAGSHNLYGGFKETMDKMNFKFTLDLEKEDTVATNHQKAADHDSFNIHYAKKYSESVVSEYGAQSEGQIAISPQKTTNSPQSAQKTPQTNNIGIIQHMGPIQQVQGTPISLFWGPAPVDASGAPCLQVGAAMPFQFNINHELLKLSAAASLGTSEKTPEDVRHMRRAQSNRESAKRAKKRREQYLSDLEASLQEALDKVKRLEGEKEELNAEIIFFKDKLQKESAAKAHTSTPLAPSVEGRQADITFPLSLFPNEDWGLNLLFKDV